MGVIIGVPPQADILAIVPLCAAAGKCLSSSMFHSDSGHTWHCCHHSPLGSRGGVVIELIVGWQQLKAGIVVLLWMVTYLMFHDRSVPELLMVRWLWSWQMSLSLSPWHHRSVQWW